MPRRPPSLRSPAHSDNVSRRLPPQLHEPALAVAPALFAADTTVAALHSAATKGALAVEYVSDPRRFFDRAASDARLLRQEWDIAAQAVETHVLGWLTRPARESITE